VGDARSSEGEHAPDDGRSRRTVDRPVALERRGDTVTPFHFSPDFYLEMVRAEIPVYDEFQHAVADATAGADVRRILDLGTGTGETAHATRASRRERGHARSCGRSDTRGASRMHHRR